MTGTPLLPEIVSRDVWQAELDALLVKEKELTRAQDAVSAQRRRLPMVKIEKEYTFASPGGQVSLLDLFEGRRQLVVYHFMLHPGDEAGCTGCSLLVDDIGHLAHLHARDVTLTVVAPATLPEIERYKQRMGWTVPWVSAHGSDFTDDCGVGKMFGISVFLRDGGDVYRTYFTTNRGGEQLITTLRYIDLTPFGRQEAWQESARGTDAPGAWWRRHDEY